MAGIGGNGGGPGSGTGAGTGGGAGTGATLSAADRAALAQAHLQNTDARLTLPATYGAPLAAGQVVVLLGGTAYPVTSRMNDAVSGLLAVVLDTGPAGTVSRVLRAGDAAAPRYNFPAGPVSLGAEGFPVAGWPADGGHHVPLGFSAGGASFDFQPQPRSFRSF